MYRRSRLLFSPATLVLLSGLAAAACGGENPKLMVTGIEPDKGDAEGGSYVRIRGNRFTADGPRSVKVYFGGRQGNVSRFESDSVLIVEAPGGKPDEVVDVLIVFDPGGQLKIPQGFRYFERNNQMPSVNDLNINKDSKDSKDKK
jgi:IPT/TIG domain